MAECLITGATGFIGYRLYKNLKQDNETIYVIQRHRSHLFPDQVQLVQDLTDETYDICLPGQIETIFHCAGYAHAFTNSSKDKHWSINYYATKRLLDFAANHGVQRFIFLSSVKAMGQAGEKCIDETCSALPESEYGKSKKAAEDEIFRIGKANGMHVVSLRLSMVYGKGGKGNLDRMARGIQSGWFPPLPETHNKRSLIHVDDVISAIRLVAKAPKANGNKYILANKDHYSGRQIYDVMRKIIGKSSVKWSFPKILLRSGGYLGDVMNNIEGLRAPISTEIVERLLGSECYLADKIFRELGWKAQINLEEGLSEMLGISTDNLHF